VVFIDMKNFTIRLLTLVFLAPFLPLSAVSQAGPPPRPTPEHSVRNFDARIPFNAGFHAAPTAAGLSAAAELRRLVPGLVVRFDRATGVTRSVSQRVGYLTPPSANPDATAVALAFIDAHHDLLGLAAEDLADFEVTDTVFSRVTGATHLYLGQRHLGLEVYNGQLQINVNREGRILSVHNRFMPQVGRAAVSAHPTRSAAEAVLAAAEHLGIEVEAPVQRIDQEPGAEQRTRLEQRQISREPIEARLAWLTIRAGDARLVWNFQIHTLDHQHLYDFNIDARSGQVWTRFDWVSSDDHRVFPAPVESPNHAAVPPPADGRTVVSNPADATASPSGWFDDGTPRTITRGNNVNAYEDSNGSNSPSSGQPDCGPGLVCDFDAPIDFGTQAPSTYRDAAVANLFYWNNIIHDIQYQYGFDEAAGNFQEQNFGKGGLGSDAVQAEAQDTGNCNANFLAPPDGTNPRMQMFLCTTATPTRDGDFDNGVIVHEYGHGISVRQVGGPANSSCLDNNQQPGEGWSDWLALVYTAEVGDQGTDARGIGTYLFGQAPDGPGIRPQPYSTDPGVNNYTYESINGAGIPHGVGSVWAQVLWEMYWALVDTYGFDPDLYDAGAGAGNHRALLYVNEGLKNTACSPTFVDTRDGILQAAIDNFGGADTCLLWEVFGNYGLGTDAISGGSSSTNPTNGFALPPECTCQPFPVADAGPDQIFCGNGSVTVGTPAVADNTYLWSPGGQSSAQITVSPGVDTVYTVTATTAACGSDQDSATVFVDPVVGLSEDFEGDTSVWTTTGLWHQVASSTCASPELGYSSPVNAVYYGDDGLCTYNVGSTSGTLTSPLILGLDTSSTLSFDYFRVVESFPGSYDKTEVEVVTESGATTVFALDTATPSTAAWTASGPISLAAFAGQAIRVRFRFDSVDGIDNGFIGWFVDDVVVAVSDPCSCSAASDDLDLQSQTITSTQLFEACQTITAGSGFQIDTPGDVTFHAGAKIILENGFSVGSGARFTAVIGTP
jgi:extracellular elastinolytic metalloproteinase